MMTGSNDGVYVEVGSIGYFSIELMDSKGVPNIDSDGGSVDLEFSVIEPEVQTNELSCRMD